MIFELKNFKENEDKVDYKFTTQKAKIDYVNKYKIGNENKFYKINKIDNNSENYISKISKKKNIY